MKHVAIILGMLIATSAHASERDLMNKWTGQTTEAEIMAVVGQPPKKSKDGDVIVLKWADKEIYLDTRRGNRLLGFKMEGSYE